MEKVGTSSGNGRDKVGSYDNKAYTWASLYYACVRGFVSGTSDCLLLTVMGSLQWVKKETCSHSGRCLVSRKFKFFLGNPNINWLTEQRTRTIAKKYYGLGATSSLACHSRVTSQTLDMP